MSNTTVDVETYKETEATDKDLIKGLWSRSRFESLSCKYQTVIPSVVTSSYYYWVWPELSWFIYFILSHTHTHTHISPSNNSIFFFVFFSILFVMIGLNAWLSPKNTESNSFVRKMYVWAWRLAEPKDVGSSCQTHVWLVDFIREKYT